MRPQTKHLSSRILFAAMCLFMVLAVSAVYSATAAEAPQKEKQTETGWLGVTVQNVNEHAAKALGLKKSYGSLVDDVLAGQPAMKAGIQAGDVVTALDGAVIPDARSLISAVAKLKPGTSTAVTVWRDGKEQVISATVGVRPVSEQSGGCCCGTGKGQTIEGPKLGVMIWELSAEEAKRGGLSGGLLVVKVLPGSPAYSSGLQKGDVIVALGNTPILKAEELNSAMNKAAGESGAVLLRIFRGGQYYFIGVSLADQKAQ